jgi:hypothetical protein
MESYEAQYSMSLCTSISRWGDCLSALETFRKVTSMAPKGVKKRFSVDPAALFTVVDMTTNGMFKQILCIKYLSFF